MDGIDLGCYLPQSKGFVPFLQEASDAWHKEGLSVSLTLHPNQILSDSKQYQLVDRINLMAYDMITANGVYHAELESVKKAVSLLVKSGCPRSKIVVGFPGYARHLQKPQIVKTFAEIYDGIFATQPTNDRTRELLYSKHTHQGLVWDSPSLVEEKVHYVKTEKLGGVFLWELGHDKQIADVAMGGLLLEAASESMRGVSSRTNHRQEQHRNQVLSEEDGQGEEL
jgi:GH18 family chitinase